jgi:Dehydrogenases with different specificities (related to short-chain alcohol dehydrogenases)
MLEGKLALVTGSSRNIGRAIALRLAREGADIIVNYVLHRRDAEQTAKDIESLGVKATVLRANLAEPEKIDEMFDAITDNFGRLDIFINNAASGTPRPAMGLDLKAWDWTMNVNARAFLLCAQRAAKLMEERGGKIVTLSSSGSIMALPNYTPIGVSKATLETLTRYFAIELAPKNICVNTVRATFVETAAGRLYAEAMPFSFWKTTPAGRTIKPEDVANVVAFLCSEDAFMIRGQSIIVDGGISLSPAGAMSSLEGGEQ